MGAPPEASGAQARVGYYAHHHGRGHVARAGAILRHVRAPATLFTSASAEPPTGVALRRLAMDLPESSAPEADLPACLHYAPVGHAGVRERMAALATWASGGPAVLVVDVSVEVALLGRLLSLPVVIVRQHGDRTDPAHEAAYRAAVACLAPYPEALEDPTAPGWLRAKTEYAGGLSRFPHRQRPGAFEPRTVALVGGGGSGGPASGAAWTVADVRAAARATPGWRWRWLGSPPEARAASGEDPPNLERLGWVPDPFPAMAGAEIVVTAAGHNATMEAAAAGRPLVVFAEPRPFAEHAHKAAALARTGAALAPGRWLAPEAWPALLDRASSADPAPLRALASPEAPRRAAAFLDGLAARLA